MNSRATTAARWLSRLLHPFSVCGPALFAALYLDTRDVSLAFRWTGVTLLVFLLPLGAFVLVMLRSGRYTDADVRLREQRHSAYAVAGLCLLALLAAFALGRAPRVAYACVLTIGMGTFLGGLINQVEKISVHVLVVVSCATALTLLAWPVGLGLGLGALLVSWARVYLGCHTLRQVGLGWIVAVVSATGVFAVLMR